MRVSELTGRHNYFEDFKVGEVLKHARGKTVEPLEQVWITNVTMNTAEAHFNEHLTKGTNYGQRLGFGGVTISMCIGLADVQMAPTGSSTLSTRSTNSTETHTRTPAIRPMITEPTGLTNPEGAVIATSPASSPLPLMEASGFP